MASEWKFLKFFNAVLKSTRSQNLRTCHFFFGRGWLWECSIVISSRIGATGKSSREQKPSRKVNALQSRDSLRVQIATNDWREFVSISVSHLLQRRPLRLAVKEGNFCFVFLFKCLWPCSAPFWRAEATAYAVPALVEQSSMTHQLFLRCAYPSRLTPKDQGFSSSSDFQACCCLWLYLSALQNIAEAWHCVGNAYWWLETGQQEKTRVKRLFWMVMGSFEFHAGSHTITKDGSARAQLFEWQSRYGFWVPERLFSICFVSFLISFYYSNLWNKLAFAILFF